MSQINDKNETKKGGTTVNIEIDVTKIVKYSCVTSAVIVFTVFASGVIKKYFDR